jgi:hypothetical protein
MKKILLLAVALCLPLLSQDVRRWSATTGDVSLSGAGTTATVQQPATNATQTIIEQVIVYCSVACNVMQASGGSTATTTAGTVQPLAPTAANAIAPFQFFTASNVGAGTAQGGALHLPAGATISICFTSACGAGQDVYIGPNNANYSVSVSSITGTANITFILRTR